MSNSLHTVTLGAALLFMNQAMPQKDGLERPPDPSVLASENVKELLFLIDADKNGKITNEEWMNIMSAEFDRLDVDKSGVLDRKELMRSRVQVKPARFSDLGK